MGSAPSHAWPACPSVFSGVLALFRWGGWCFSPFSPSCFHADCLLPKCDFITCNFVLVYVFRAGPCRRPPPILLSFFPLATPPHYYHPRSPPYLSFILLHLIPQVYPSPPLVSPPLSPPSPFLPLPPRIPLSLFHPTNPALPPLCGLCFLNTSVPASVFREAPLYRDVILVL